MLGVAGDGERGQRRRNQLFRLGLVLLALGVCGAGAGAILQERDPASALALTTGAGALVGLGLLALLSRPGTAARAAGEKAMDEAEWWVLEAREAKRSVKLAIAMVLLTGAVLMDLAVGASVLRGQAPPTDLTVIVLAIVTLGLAALALAHAPGAEAKRLAGSPGRRDREQHKRAHRLGIIAVVGLVGGVLGSLGSAGVLSGELNLSTVPVAVWSALWGLALPVMVMGWDGGARRVKRFLEDELTRAFRARAITTGFWVLLPGVVAAYVVGLSWPEWAVAALPVVMTGAGAAACLHFALLHRAADRDE